MSLSEWVEKSIRCLGPCGKTMSYNKFRYEDMMKPYEEMNGEMACSYCHGGNYKTHVTQETMDAANVKYGTDYKDGDIIRAIKFVVVSQEVFDEMQVLDKAL